MKSTEEIKPLTSIRMLAAALVLVYHYYPAQYPGLLHSIVKEGHIGVTIFFALSGFLITLRYYPAYAEYGLSRSLVYDFFTKRFARIYPLYAFVLFIFLISAPDFFYQFKTLVSFTLTQSFFNALKSNHVAVAWTLTVEESFYLSAPLVFVTLAAAYRRLPRIWTVVIILVGWTGSLFLIGLLVTFAPLPIRPFGFMETTQHLVIYTLFGRFYDFALGILAAMLYLTGRLDRLHKYSRGMLVLSLVSTAGIVLSQHLMNQAGGVYTGWQYNYLIALCACLLFISLRAAENPLARLLSNRVMVYGGKISYALYLIHLTPLMLPVQQLFSTSQPLPVYQAGIYTGATILSIVLYERVEKPARQWVLTTAARYKPRIIGHLDPS